jgi:cell division protein FtsI (penicillin-binding protein 3)
MSEQVFRPSFVSRWAWGIERAFEKARTSGKASDDTRLRIFFVLALFAAGFLTLMIGASGAALFSGLGKGDALGAPVGAARADLVDRNGQMLAADLLHYGLYIDPREIWDTAETRRELTRALPTVTPDRLERALRSPRRTFLVGGLTPAQRGVVHEMGLPGVSFEPEQRRVYPLGINGAHVIGFSDSGGEGLTGAEAALNEDIRNAAAGHGTVPLSIDLRIQAALDEELDHAAQQFRPRGAVGIITNVHTGEILALSSWPNFDPNRANEASDDAKLNRAASSVFEMGSTFKSFTVAAGLDSGVATPNSTFDARVPFQLGYRVIHDYHACHCVLNLVEVFQHSSNIGTAHLAESLGVQRLEHYFNALGLTQPAKVELVESARPLTPKKWDDDAVASTSFGHGINVSPLALARAMGALTNGGMLYPLTIRKQAADYRPQGTRAVSEQTSATMLQIMRANVWSKVGSGGHADIKGLNVGGKTGTGEKYDPAIRGYSHTKQVSSFAAVFPTDGPTSAPRYFVLILMDEPQPSKESFGFTTGGFVGAPAAGKIINRIAPFLGVTKRAETQPFAPSATATAAID